MPTLTTVNTMSSTSVLSLGVALATIAFGNGCSTLALAGKTSASNELDRIPDKLEVDETPVTASPAEAEPYTVAETEEEPPYMAPPIIPGVDPTKPILPEPETAPEPSGSVTDKTPEKPQKQEDLATAPPEQQTDLYYAPGSNIPFSGEARILHENGKPYYEGQFKDGYRIGKGMEWHPDGQVKYAGEWKKNPAWVRYENGEHVPFTGSTPSWSRSVFYEGSVSYYYSGTDKLKLRGEYLKGQLISGLNLDRNGQSY